MAVEYTDAWNLWWEDTLSRDAVVLGLKVYVWGRIGIVLDLIGSMTVISELVGSDRLRAFGQSMRGAISVDGLKGSVIAAFKLILDCFVAFFWFGKKGREATDRVFESPHRWIYLVITLALGTLLFAFTRGNAAPTWALIVGYFWCVAVSALVAPLLVGVLVTAISLLGLVVEPFMEGLAYLIEHPRLDKALKVGGLLLVLVGFHFTLLAA